MRQLSTVFKFLKSESPSARVFWFLLKTLVIYVVLDGAFYVYTGITVPGGSFYSTFLREHADFVGAFRRFLLWGGAQFNSFIGYPSGYTDYTLFVMNGSRVRMVYSCMGFSLMSAYAALILAWPTRWTNRLIYLVGGTILIIALNMVRLGGLAVLYNTRHYSLFQIIDHHTLFNVIMLVIVFLMFAAYLKFSDRKDVGN